MRLFNKEVLTSFDASRHVPCELTRENIRDCEKRIDSRGMAIKSFEFREKKNEGEGTKWSVVVSLSRNGFARKARRNMTFKISL